MPPPTLLVRGNFKGLGLDDVDAAAETPVGHIVRWVRTHMPEFGGNEAGLKDRILIVRAKTGSGKSTVLPVALFRLLRDERTPRKQRYRGPGVLCTQPRVLTAVTLARSAAAERVMDGKPTRLNPDMYVGETVGYKTGPLENSIPTGLIYATIGVLAAQLRTLADLDVMAKYRVIIVDEAHERSVESDLALMLLKNFYDQLDEYQTNKYF